MEIEFKELKKKDYNKIIEYAINGMHLGIYTNNKIELNLYGRYFLYLSLTSSTQIISAYMEEELAGVLFADIKGEKKVYKSFFKSLYVKMFELIQKTFFKKRIGLYDSTNKQLLANYKIKNNPDGEIKFLVANPNIKQKGIGTKLLNEFERRERGKEIYLFTDNQCTYQFYDHRGFKRMGEKDIELSVNKKKISIKCLLYSKKI